MIDLKTLESYYEEHLRPYKRNILREYLQYKILEILFNSGFGRKLIFMGGTSLRIVHNLDRFSEDLDFDNRGINRENFTEISYKIKKELELEGYEIELKTVFKGAFRSYFRFLNILFKENISPNKDEKLLIQVDTDPQDYIYTPQDYILNKFDVFTTIFITPANILLSQKLTAFLNRKRVKARDIYDIIFLFGKTEPDYIYLQEKMQIRNKNELKKELKKKSQSLNFKEMIRELEPFLINKKNSHKINLFRKFIQSI